MAAKPDRLPAVEGLRDGMLTFDDSLIGIEPFGRRTQPPMRSRTPDVRGAA